MENLLRQYKEISLLHASSALLEWDMETMMPSGAAEARGEMMSLLSQFAHRQSTDAKYVEGVMQLDPAKLTGVERRQAELLRIFVLKQHAFDEKFVARLTELTVRTHETWKKARKEKNFSLVAPLLAEMVAMQREKADRLQAFPALKAYFAGRSKYEILMDEFEPGFSAQRLRGLLGELRTATMELLPKVLAKVGSWPATPAGAFRLDNAKQLELGREVSREMGLDYGRARLDTSVHPFCTGFNGEVRITTRHDPEDFTECLLGVIHETGHALYEQNLPAALANTPAGRYVSLGVHESQSRFMENMIARSKPFAKYLSKKCGVPAETIFRHLNRVERSYIRTESDELTYNLHIILRMGLEEDMIEGKLEAKHLPERWNADFRSLLGLEVTDDSVGCMQDTHWFGGAFGYFPTYSLGNLLSAELAADFRQEVSDWEAQVEQGNFRPVVEFLRRKIHDHGAKLDSTTLMRQTLGRELGVKAFADYVKSKWEL